MMKWNRGVLALGLILSAACGSDGDEGGGSLGGSYTDIAEAIAQPTGTVDATSAPAIAEEFEKINASSTAKSRHKQAGSQQQACSGGGSINTSAQGSGESATVTFDYNNCCEASCCMNGGGTWFYSAGTGAEYTYCGNYDLSVDCGDETGTSSVKYEGCFGGGGWVYVVRVDGETYAVTGYYSAGSGSLEITGQNGSFSCTYSGGTGSCAGSSGDFSF